MDILPAIVVLVIGFAVGFVAGIKNANSKKVAASREFLDSVKKVPKGKIVFLMRDDGTRSYSYGAGWAQSQHNYGVEQVGKMPVPGQGQLDMALFGKLLGNLPMPANLKKNP